MGLDNGIRMKIKKDAEFNYALFSPPLYIDAMYTNEQTNELVFDILYWRKWYGLRNSFIKHLENKYDYDHELGYYPLDYEDISELYYILRDYNKDNWDNDYWEYKESANKIRADIAILGSIRKFMKNHNDTPVCFDFYDSY